ncbi:MAG TPA: DUF5320 domain-containing protein [Nitrospinota bacterium]|nr:DUF5320 domain-containing protein [Nitrospinota bacterium]
MYGRGRGLGYRWSRAVPSGYSYVGPCLCGFGPHAFFQDSTGRMAHASHVYSFGPVPPPSATKEDLEYELKILKDEKAELEKRLGEIEKELKKEEK